MNGHESSISTGLPIPLGPAMKQDLSEIKTFTRIRSIKDLVRVNNKITEMDIGFADPAILTMFSFKLLAGDPSKALANPNSIVLTKQNALQLFGSTDVIGKTVEVKVEDTFTPFMVSAVADDIPANSSIRFGLLVSFEYYITTRSGKLDATNWNNNSYPTYLQLQPGSKLVNDTEKLMKFRMKYYPDEVAEFTKNGLWKEKEHYPIGFRLEPLGQMHNNAHFSIEPINAKTIWILLAIAAGVLLIACINFTTLAIGRSAGRAKEIGLRKVIGSSKKQLIVQFLTEALLLAILSAIFGCILSYFLLPYFNRLSDRELQFSFVQYPEMIWLLVGLVLAIGLLAGFYPAFVLSRFKPVDVLKNNLHVGGSNLFTRSLVILQFIVSIGLIISTVIILQQVQFMQGKNPGFNKENVVMVDANGTVSKKIYPLFKQALKAEPSISAVASAEYGIGAGAGWNKLGFINRLVI